MGIAVDIILFFIIAGNSVMGYRRGLARVIFNICSTMIALILVFILYKPTTNYIIHNTQLSEKLETVFEEKLQYLFESKENEVVQGDSTNALKIFIGNDMGNLIEDTTTSMIQYVSIQISHKIISVITFLALFAIIRLVLYVFRSYVEMVADLPIIRVFNGSGGMIYGILKGFFIIYLLLAILSLLLPIMGNNIIITAIESAPIGSKMFHNNILLNLIFKFL